MPYNNWDNMKMSIDERFTSENHQTMKDRGHIQRTSNLHLEKDDIRHTRR